MSNQILHRYDILTFLPPEQRQQQLASAIPWLLNLQWQNLFDFLRTYTTTDIGALTAWKNKVMLRGLRVIEVAAMNDREEEGQRSLGETFFNVFSQAVLGEFGEIGSYFTSPDDY